MSGTLVESGLTEAEKAECRKWSAAAERQEFLDNAALALMPALMRDWDARGLPTTHIAEEAYRLALALWNARKRIIDKEPQDEQPI